MKVILQTGEGGIFTAGLDLRDESVSRPDTVISDPFLNTIRYSDRSLFPQAIADLVEEKCTGA